MIDSIFSRSLLRAIRKPEYFQVAPLIIETFPDNPVTTTANFFTQKFGLPFGQILNFLNSFSIVVPTSLLDIIASFDFVKKIYIDLPRFALWRYSPMEGSWIGTEDVVKMVKLDKLHAQGIKGDGVSVAAIDTGVDLAQPQLQGRVTGAYTTVPLSDPHDRQGHGSFVGTMIAGKPFKHPLNNMRMTGGAPNCIYRAYKALSDAGFGSTSDILKSMELAVEHGARLINMSLGGEGNESENEDPMVIAIEKFTVAYPDVLWVVAAGNSGPGSRTLGIPAVAPSAITVGSLGVHTGKAAGFSSRGPCFDGRMKPDIMGVGGDDVVDENIYSGSSMGSMLDFADRVPYPDGFTSLKGSSMSTPNVHSVLTCWKQIVPDLTAEDVKRIFKAFGHTKDNNEGHGLIDATWILSASEAPRQPVSASAIRAKRVVKATGLLF